MALKQVEFRLPPIPAAALEATALTVGLGVVFGVLLFPLLGLRRGVVWHLLALFAAWLALARWVAPDPGAVDMWATGPVVGFALLLLGRGVARWVSAVPWVLAAAILVTAIAVPVVIDRQRAVVEPAAVISAEPPAGAPDIVMIVLDTVRAHNVSAYGYERETTPYFDRLAEEGMLFLDATAPSTWSLPAHASLFTGRFPSGHGAHGEHRVLGAETPTLAAVLAHAGYETRCFTANPHISDGFGLTRGFQWSDRAWLGGAGGRSFVFVYRVLDLLGWNLADKGGGDVARNFEQWVAAARPHARPAFVFINFLEAHFPYHQVPREFLGRFAERSPRELRRISLTLFGAQFGRALTPREIEEARAPARNMYDAGILYSDHLLSRVVEALRTAGTLDRTILVVLSDHGEMLGEHGDFGHGFALYEPDVRVPLLIRYPPRVAAGIRRAEPVSTTGVYATVLELAGIEPPGPVHVGSLLAAPAGKRAAAPVITERFAQPVAPGARAPLSMRDRRYRVYRSGSKKLVQTSRGDTFLFDIARDPGEHRDLASAEPLEVAPLRDELAAWTNVLGLPPIDAPLSFETTPEIDPAVRDRLEALGYAE